MELTINTASNKQKKYKKEICKMCIEVLGHSKLSITKQANPFKSIEKLLEIDRVIVNI